MTRKLKLLISVAAALLLASTVVASSPTAAMANNQITLFNEIGSQTGNDYHNPSFQQPSNYEAPVNYADGNGYLRMEILAKPSNLNAFGQFCMWRHSPGKTDFKYETCAPTRDDTFTSTGVYYIDLHQPSSWWAKRGIWDWTQGASIMRIMLFEKSSELLLMETKCGGHCYPGDDLDDHVPIQMRSHLIFVPAGEELDPPTLWQNDCPAEWSSQCGAAPSNQAPDVEAGDDIEVVSENPISVAISGSFTDDALPDGATVTTTWTGPAGVTFDDDTALATNANLPGPGQYELDLAANDTELTGNDTLTITVIDPNAPPPVEVLLIAGTANGSAHDQITAQTLIDAGYVVTIIDDNVVSQTDADGADIVLISATVAASAIGQKINDTTTPIVSYEYFHYDDTGMTPNGNANRGQVGGRSIDIVDPSHPIANGLSGVTEVLTASSKITWGKPADSAQIVATLANDASKAAIFTYDTGDEMENGIIAAGPRAGLFITIASDDKLNANGEQLLLNTMAWADGDPVNRAPNVDAGANIEVVSENPVSVAISGSFTDDALPDGATVTTTWTGPAGVTFDDDTALATNANLPGPGQYELDLAANDTELTGNDTVTITVIDPNTPDPTDVLFVAGSATGSGHDQIIIQALTGAGNNVTVIDDDVVTQTDADNVDVVVVSASVAAVTVGQKITGTTSGIVSYEYFHYDDVGLTPNGNPNRGQTSGKSIDVTNPSHPIADGVSGVTQIFTANSKIAWGKPAPAAQIVATLTNDPTKAAVFTYDTGDQMEGGIIAAGPRAGIFITNSSDSRLNATGEQFLLNAVDWAAGA